MPRDWVAWHEDYETSSPLARRLAIVQHHVERTLEERGDARIRVLSLCSGEGRDLVAPLSGRAPASKVIGRLIGKPEPFRTGARLFDFIDA
jgi:hypothetical protein